MEKGIKTYNIGFNEDDFESGIDMIAITDNPAMETFALRFSQEPKRLTFSYNEDKGIIAGAVLIPNKPILRYNDQKDEYFQVVFSEEVIEKMVNKFNSEQRPKKFNIEHDNNYTVQGFIKGSWLVEDPTKDKSAFYGFEDLPKGTWFIEAQITDKETWNDTIKKMETIGFSIEGLMGAIGYQFNNLITQKKESMKLKFNKTSQTFDRELSKFVDTVEQEEMDVEISEVAVGGTVNDSEGNPVVDGIYDMEDGTTLFVVDGKIEVIVPYTEEQEEMEEEEEKEKETKEEFTDESEDTKKEEEEFQEEEEEKETEVKDTKYDELVDMIADLNERMSKIEEMQETDEDFEKEKFNQVKPNSISNNISLIKNLRNKK